MNLSFMKNLNPIFSYVSCLSLFHNAVTRKGGYDSSDAVDMIMVDKVCDTTNQTPKVRQWTFDTLCMTISSQE
jgi:hypothetical protein